MISAVVSEESATISTSAGRDDAFKLTYLEVLNLVLLNWGFVKFD